MCSLVLNRKLAAVERWGSYGFPYFAGVVEAPPLASQVNYDGMLKAQADKAREQARAATLELRTNEAEKSTLQTEWFTFVLHVNCINRLPCPPRIARRVFAVSFSRLRPRQEKFFALIEGSEDFRRCTSSCKQAVLGAISRSVLLTAPTNLLYY